MELVSEAVDGRAGGGQWIGPPLSRPALGALLLLGTVGMEITGVQPVLLGALVNEGRLSPAGLGWATTAEFLSIAIAIGLAGGFLKPRRLRWIAAGAALIAICADLLTFTGTGSQLIVYRGVAGFAEGLLVWMPTCMVARSPTPAFWAGVFLTLQCSAQLAFASILPLTLMARFGANAGFGVLAVLSLLALAAAPLLPSSFADLPSHGARKGLRAALPDLRGAAGLLAVFLVAAFAIGLFAYLGPLADQARLGTATLGLAVSAALGAEIVGATIASMAARHLRHYPAFLICLAAYVAVLVILATKPGATSFIFAGGLFGFFQVFFMPFQLPLVIEADPSRRSAVILPSIQLLGAASGPFFCSFFVTDTDARGALAVCGACLAATLILTTYLHFGAHRAVTTLVGEKAGAAPGLIEN